MTVPEVFDAPRPIHLTVDDYQALHEAGALDRHRHAELIDGVIVSMSPQRLPHTVTVNEISRRFHDALRQLGWPLASLATPTVAMPPSNVPEPDVALVREPLGDGYVQLASVALLVEVSASTLRFDLGDKKRLYATNGVPEYWVVDVNRREVHQFWRPRDADYRESRVVPLADELASATMPELAIDGAGILP